MKAGDYMEQIDNLSVGDLVYVPEYGMGIVWRHHDHLEDITLANEE